MYYLYTLLICCVFYIKNKIITAYNNKMNYNNQNENNNNQYHLPPIEYQPQQNDSNKKNINYSYRQNILDNTMLQNGNVLFERYPTATRLSNNDTQKTKLIVSNNNDNYYLSNRLTFNQNNNLSHHEQSANVVCDFVPQYTRNQELEKKSNKYYEPQFNINTNPLPFFDNSNDLANSNGFMKNTRSKSKIDLQPYTPNPMASNLPINTTNKNPQIPKEILSVDTRSINYSNGSIGSAGKRKII